jgi:hypothetical protein
LPQVDPHHFLDWRKHEDESWAFSVLLEAAKGENYAALILAQDFDSVEKIESKNNNWN